MKDVDQQTGKDLNPQNTKRLKSESAGLDPRSSESQLVSRNPDRPDNLIDIAPIADDDFSSKKKSKKFPTLRDGSCSS